MKTDGRGICIIVGFEGIEEGKEGGSEGRNVAQDL
jgi:hypothetical protein